MASDYYPHPGFHFRVDFQIEGKLDPPNSEAITNDVRFQEVSGISVQLDVESINQGGVNDFVQQFPSRAKYSDLVCKRGYLNNSNIYEWCRLAIEELDIRPATVIVNVLNEKHEPLVAYNFVNVWPKKWELTGLDAQNSGILIESIEFAYQNYKKMK